MNKNPESTDFDAIESSSAAAVGTGSDCATYMPHPSASTVKPKVHMQHAAALYARRLLLSRFVIRFHRRAGGRRRVVLGSAWRSGSSLSESGDRTVTAGASCCISNWSLRPFFFSHGAAAMAARRAPAARWFRILTAPRDRAAHRRLKVVANSALPLVIEELHGSALALRHGRAQVLSAGGGLLNADPQSSRKV